MPTYSVSFDIDIKSYKIDRNASKKEFAVVDTHTKNLLRKEGIPPNVLKIQDSFSVAGFSDKIWPTRSYFFKNLTNAEATKLTKVVRSKDFGGKNVIKERERELRKDFKQLTLNDIRKSFINKNNEFMPISFVDTAEDVPKKYTIDIIFIPDGNALIGSDKKLVEDWLLTKETQKKGQLVYLTGMISFRSKKVKTGLITSAGTFYNAGDLQVCDGNIISSNCTNSKAFINKKLLVKA